jgi:hypothetical protein
MADIFISYARADRPRAEELAHALERTGWSVWWDREIPPGRSFDEVIEEALTAARCVIVVWSDASVRSEWVKTEAAEAAQRRILVPILADGARIPLEFRRIQAAALHDWHTLESNDGWPQLCDAVAALVDSVRRVPAARVATPARRSILPWVVSGGVSLALVTVAAAAYLATRPVSPASAQPAPARPAAAPARPAVAAAPAAASVASVPAPAPLDERIVPAPPATRPRPRRPALESESLAKAEAPSSEHAPSALAVRPLPIETTTVTPDVVRKLEREPRLEAIAASFDVTLISGVFRDQGRLSVSPTGVRFSDGGGAGRAFELSCGALRRVATATMIADREQRLLEITVPERSYRVIAADTGARDGIRAAIGRTCAR